MSNKNDSGVLWLFGFLFLLGIFYYLTIAILIIGLGGLAIWLLFLLVRYVYFSLKPEAKERFLKKRALEAEAKVRAEAQETRRRAEAMKRIETEKRHKEKEKRLHRDAESQNQPYKYEIGRHANETLAIRYGIANLEKEVVPYYYFAKGGEKRRNSDRDKIRWKDASFIKLQKVKKLKPNQYEVLLSDFRNRKAIAIIEPGTEYVKTFYPKNSSWFQRHADLEEVLKGNSSMSLKDLAHYHIQKAVGSGKNAQPKAVRRTTPRLLTSRRSGKP